MIEDGVFEGKDLEEALAAAATALGVPEADLRYEMVEQGRRGLLGLGVRHVRIRVQPTALDEPQPAPRPRRTKPPVRTALVPEPEAGETTVTPELVRDVEKTVTKMVGLMGLELQVVGEERDGGVSLELNGPDQPLLLARNGELLSALQFVLNRMTHRTWPGTRGIQIGCDGRRRPRDEELVTLARRVATEVSRTGRTRKLRPMNAYERRLVHITVQEFGGLTSSSEGTGALKRVRISRVQNQI